MDMENGFQTTAWTGGNWVRSTARTGENVVRSTARAEGGGYRSTARAGVGGYRPTEVYTSGSGRAVRWIPPQPPLGRRSAGAARARGVGGAGGAPPLVAEDVVEGVVHRLLRAGRVGRGGGGGTGEEAEGGRRHGGGPW